MQQRHPQPGKAERRLTLVILCAAGLLVNFLGVRLARGLGLPVFLDNIGSALVAALGGYIPGIIVGFFTNLVNGIGDIETTYYGSLTVLIAVASAYFASKGFYQKPKRLPIIILTFALIGGGLGSVLTYLLYGAGFGTGISAPLAHMIYDKYGWSVFWSQFTADMLIDLLDKTITVLIVALALRLIPKGLKARVFFTSWRQTPLSRQLQLEVENTRTRRTSLRLKVTLLVAAGMVFTALVVTLISYIHFSTASVNEQKQLAKGVVQVVQGSFDHDRVDEYIEKGEAAEGYLESEAILKRLMDSSQNVEYCYVYRILPDGCHVVFDPDTPEMPGEDPGAVVEFDQAFMKDLDKLLAGEPIDPIISDEKYGWLLTIYEPCYDSSGVCQCYAAVDINMDHIRNTNYQFVARVVSLFFAFFVIILTAAVWLAEYNVILPINTMAITTDQFAFDAESVREDMVEKIKGLNIHTGDEIENLYKAVVKTTEDMVRYIAYTQLQNQKINKLQNGLILVLADMVESRDQCTGEHVRKTAAYARIIMEQLKKDGVYADQLTEAYMNDVENSAPLHDVGKIQVPDAVLNKPGKLTAEEFDLMKTHTTAGSEIIDSAMHMVSEEDSGYLREARNLAHFHHEKWNGKGYPCGLAGEEIPLSARIMAVADVFDALVSRRPYKEGFSFEKAMGIIHEESGTHFDPKIVTAFEHAEPEVRRIMESNMER